MGFAERSDSFDFSEQIGAAETPFELTLVLIDVALQDYTK
jgi:hypothetical protein